MPQQVHTRAAARSAADKVDPDYERITLKGLEEYRAELQAEEERRKASAPPPDTRTPEQMAEHLRAFAGAAFLHGAFRSGGGPVFDVATFKHYEADFLRRSGASGDPVEEMLLRQLLQADLAVGRLHVAASASKDPAAAGAYCAAAARLMAEFRRSTLALEQYREAARRRAAAAAPADHQGSKGRKAAANGKAGGKKRMKVNTELGSNHAPNNRLNEYFHEREPECEPALA